MPAHVTLFLASSNPGKLAEYRALVEEGAHGVKDASAPRVEIDLLPGFDSLPSFEENAETFAENASGKALHYSRLCKGLILSDDSGLIVPALDGAPGVRSARYAGTNATDAANNAKLLDQLRKKKSVGGPAYFVCVLALAEQGRAIAIVSARVEGEIMESLRGVGGFGYDPLFYFPPLNKTFAELKAEEKNRCSHRGKAFGKLLAAIRF